MVLSFHIYFVWMVDQSLLTMELSADGSLLYYFCWTACSFEERCICGVKVGCNESSSVEINAFQKHSAALKIKKIDLNLYPLRLMDMTNNPQYLFRLVKCIVKHITLKLLVDVSQDPCYITLHCFYRLLNPTIDENTSSICPAFWMRMPHV